MKRISRIVAAASAAAFVFAAAPSMAQYAGEYSPAKLIKQGKTSKDIAGNGTVIVQVQVNPDGSHKVVKVIKSTNPADNDAAMDIAANSSYRPAHQGTKPITAFYDFTLKFSGKSVSSNEASGGAGSAGSAGIEGLIRAGKYADAEKRAQSALLSNPSDERTRQLLGLAAYYNGDYDTSAQSFSRVSTIDKQFQPIAAQAFASASIGIADKNPTEAMTYAQKAVSLGGGNTAQLALGVAQIANKQNTEGLATLKAVHEKLFADPKTATNVKIGVDSRLLTAYLATGDSAGAQSIANEMKQLDPSSTVPARVMGNHYLEAGSAALQAKNYADALKNFDLAANTGDPQVAVTANTQAAFSLLSMDKPDFAKVKAYADKALAVKPDSPEANYAEGVAYTGTYASSHKDDDKKQALSYLNKADGLAKAAGNTALALQIETFIKNNFK
jgi:TonB family protein